MGWESVAADVVGVNAQAFLAIAAAIVTRENNTDAVLTFLDELRLGTLAIALIESSLLQLTVIRERVAAGLRKVDIQDELACN